MEIWMIALTLAKQYDEKIRGETSLRLHCAGILTEYLQERSVQFYLEADDPLTDNIAPHLLGRQQDLSLFDV